MHKLNFSGIQLEQAKIAKSATYLLFANSEDFGIELAMSSLDEQNKNFIISQDPDRFLAKAKHWSKASCQTFSLDKGFFIENRSSFIEQTFEELSFYAGFSNGHLIIHFSEALTSRFDEKFIARFLQKSEQLAEKYNVSLLFLMTGKSALEKTKEFILHNDLLAGLAHLNSHLMNHRLVFDFWRHSEGISTKVSYLLYFDESPYAQIEEHHEDDNILYQQNLDQVFIAKELLPSDTKLPPNYHVCEDNNSVLESAKSNKAATVVLYASRDVEKAVLAAQCYELREHCGPWLKIVIKNKDGVLRHHDECVFLTLGVNLILHTTTDISRLMSQVQALQGVKFARVLPKDYKAVLAHANGVEVKGYLTPQHFVDAVKIQREASLSTGISGVLVALDLIKGIDAIDALRLFSVKRNGDFFTANRSQVLLYLHGCRENDVTNALERLFRLAISEFFVAHAIYSQDLYIEEICRDLKLADENKELEDYSIQLLESALEEQPLAMSTSGRTSVVSDINRFPSRKECKPFTLELMDSE
ncbi:cellulose biosynthesis protein BcsE [Pseudoalteromonas sp. G4]|uniref:cellulose biosynthesis protein BcsE n=1 Tax=Pseudoalteromonas sp. G4 TaxID=2992761 RepID=UPI00237E2249|nr:cellulose biosynthesis protein BcsE [Pseudoalteromonas sp. G4]MDE3271114.1 cellulose biosynthesis protein BcsE [Pseudoalteromonas sp. G4]